MTKTEWVLTVWLGLLTALALWRWRILSQPAAWHRDLVEDQRKTYELRREFRNEARTALEKIDARLEQLEARETVVANDDES